MWYLESTQSSLWIFVVWFIEFLLCISTWLISFCSHSLVAWGKTVSQFSLFWSFLALAHNSIWDAIAKHYIHLNILSNLLVTRCVPKNFFSRGGKVGLHVDFFVVLIEFLSTQSINLQVNQSNNMVDWSKLSRFMHKIYDQIGALICWWVSSFLYWCCCNGLMGSGLMALGCDVIIKLGLCCLETSY